MGKPGLTSAGSAPHGPDPLGTATTNGWAARARRPQRRLEAPGGRGGALEGTQQPTARQCGHPITHSPRAAGRRPVPCLASPGRGPAPSPHTHRPRIYLRRAPPRSRTCYLGPPPPAPPPSGPRGRAGMGGANRRATQSRPERRPCARSDWAALGQTFFQWLPGRSAP